MNLGKFMEAGDNLEATQMPPEETTQDLVDAAYPSTMYNWTAAGAADEAMKHAEQVPEITWKDVGNVALDFTPIIGDVKGGYETVAMIGEELQKDNPNYYLIGAMGGLGAVATILGLVPWAGDAAQKAIMEGTRMMAEKSGQLAGEVKGAARAIRDGDLEFLLARGNVDNTVGVGADVVSKATKNQLDPVRLTGSSKGFYRNKAPNYVPDIEVKTSDQGILMDEIPLTIEELKEENAALIPLLADRTEAGKTLTGISGGAREYTLTNPEDLQGGKGFPRYPDTGAFASMESVIGPQVNTAQSLAKQGFAPKGLVMTMGPEGGDFSVNMSNTVMDMMAQSPITKKNMRKLDAWIKDNIDPKFPGMNDPDAKRFLAEDVSGTRRQKIWKYLDTTDFVDQGFPTMGDARVAITKPDLLTVPNMQGTTVVNFDGSGRLLEGPYRKHNTYSHQASPTGAAGYRGELEALPYEIIMRDFFENRRNIGTSTSGDQRSLSMSKFAQGVDDQMVEEVNQYIEFIDLAERDSYLKNISNQRQNKKIYRFGDNGGPPLDDQMSELTSNPIQPTIIKEGVPTIEAAGLTDESIEAWRSANETTKEFRDALKGRNVELQELATGVSEGRVFNTTYYNRADELRPIRVVTEVPKPASNQEIVSALNDKQRKNPIIGLNEKVSTGESVEVRLNIPAYTDYNIWVPTIRHGGKEKYKAAVRLKNVNFIKPTLSGGAKRTDSSKALKVAEGGQKNPFAVMKGEYIENTDSEIYDLATQAFDDPSWTQVGFDPTRRGFFYDRKTGQAILEGTEVIQVGNLVLVKNAVKETPEAFTFSKGGFMMPKYLDHNL